MPDTGRIRAGYGVDSAFRDGVTALGLAYVAGIPSHTSPWPPGTEPLPPKPWSGQGRPPSRLRRDAEHAPVPAKDLAASLPKRAWRGVTWREGSNATLTRRFAAVRVRPAHRDTTRAVPRPEERLLAEWPKGEPEPTKCWRATLPPETSLRAMVDGAKLRGRIERDDQDLKQELGPGHDEGRGWRGYHHRATPCIAAYGFLIAERGAFPPLSQLLAIPPSTCPTPGLPTPRRPRSGLNATSRPR